MSVDLVGSTSYKTKAGSLSDASGADPRWVKQIKHFYRDFPAQIKTNYRIKCSSLNSNNYSMCCPHVWKTVGDEIILCCRLVDMQHAFLCIDVFSTTLKNYGYWLDNQPYDLDVKGSAWTAAFPHPNITVIVNKDGDQEDERFSGSSDDKLEKQADDDPSKFDFLGGNIDAGFRIAKYAQRDKLVLSVELAYIISTFSHLKSEMLKFYLIGKHEIKGVLGDKPYPIVAIDAERSHERRKLRTKEENLRPKINTDPNDFSEYTELFLNDAGIELPCLQVVFSPDEKHKMPSSYLGYIERWEKEEFGSKQSDEQRAEGESDEAAEGAGDLKVPQESFIEIFERLFGASRGAASSPSKSEKPDAAKPRRSQSNIAPHSKPDGDPPAKPSRRRRPPDTTR